MLRRQFKDRIKQIDEVSWDAVELKVRAVRREVFGALVLSEKRLSRPPSAALVAAWLEGLARCGLKLLNFDEACRQWCARVEFLRRHLPEEAGHWPACDEASLLREAAAWLGPLLGSIRRREELAKIVLPDLLKNRLGWKESEKLDRLAPESLRLPGGRRARLDYLAGDRPVLQARVQELFGWTETPTVAGGRVRVLLQILSPARRPVQITDDLAGFWRGSYAAVRRELRGRYPKHAWPEDPLTKR
jgi:ATP-dependent helicase HrpB